MADAITLAAGLIPTGGGVGGGFMAKASASPWTGAMSAAADAIGSFMPLKSEYSGDKGAITAGMDSAYDTISDAIANVPVWGTAASAIMKGNKLLGQGINALGGGTDGMTTQDAILGSAFFQTTPLGIINGAFGKKTDTMKLDSETLSTVGASYQGAYNDINKSVNHSGKKYGLLSQGAMKELNALIHDSGRKLNLMSTMANQVNMATNVAANQMDIASLAYAQAVNGGFDPTALRAAKHGDKLFSKELRKRATTILAKKKLGGNIEFTPFVFDLSALIDKTVQVLNTEDTQILEFKQGGSIIPEGALHARKHHLEDINPELKGLITSKGIPVIIEKEGGEVEQQAEIELNEIILQKDITEKIEEAYKKYYSDELSEKEKNDLAVEIGKLLTNEILYNTDDRTNLIKNVE